MKKLAVLLAIVAVMAVTFIPATPAFANSGNGNGFRGAGAGVGMMGQSNTGTSVNGVLHEYLIAAYADALDLSVDEIETRLAGGETLSSIAISTGLTVDEFQTLVVDARTSALDAALADGVITQSQADWLASRMGGANRQAMGNSGFRGHGVRNGFAGNCPYMQIAE
jgi:hypothetical protein